MPVTVSAACCITGVGFLETLSISAHQKYHMHKIRKTCTLAVAFLKETLLAGVRSTLALLQAIQVCNE